MVLDASCLTLSIIRYGSSVKWSNPGKGVAPSPKPLCNSYQKGRLRVTLDLGHRLYLLVYIYIYIYMCVCMCMCVFVCVCVCVSFQNVKMLLIPYISR